MGLSPHGFTSMQGVHSYWIGTIYQPGEENPEPYYEQYGDPESGELADPDQEVPYEEYQDQEVPEEEGVPEEGYEPPSEEMPNDEPEIPQG